MDDMTEFRVTYDGTALANHQMDPRELAPALLAMAELLECASKVLYGDKASLRVNVKGSFRTGSFHIDFLAGVHWLKTVRDLFAGDAATAVANGSAILGLLGFAGRKGLAQLLIWLRGRAITRVDMTPGDRDGMPQARIFVGDECFEVERETVDLLRDVGVRKAFDQVLAPLDRAGIDVFAVGQGTQINVSVGKESRHAFMAPVVEDYLLVDDIRTMVFSIVSLTLKDDNKWRLSDGSSTISATISDSAFRDSVNNSTAAFSKGDVLVCTVNIRQWQTITGARTEYDVIRVDEHRQAARQIMLPGLGKALPSVAQRP
jgi:hypothetical protein